MEREGMERKGMEVVMMHSYLDVWWAFVALRARLPRAPTRKPHAHVQVKAPVLICSPSAGASPWQSVAHPGRPGREGREGTAGHRQGVSTVFPRRLPKPSNARVNKAWRGVAPGRRTDTRTDGRRLQQTLSSSHRHHLTRRRQNKS